MLTSCSATQYDTYSECFVSVYRDRFYERKHSSAFLNLYETDWDPAEPIESTKVVQASEFQSTEQVNKFSNPSLSIQEKIGRGIVLSDDMDSVLCFEHMQNRSLGKNHSGMMVFYM